MTVASSDPSADSAGGDSRPPVGRSTRSPCGEASDGDGSSPETHSRSGASPVWPDRATPMR